MSIDYFDPGIPRSIEEIEALITDARPNRVGVGHDQLQTLLFIESVVILRALLAEEDDVLKRAEELLEKIDRYYGDDKD